MPALTDVKAAFEPFFELYSKCSELHNYGGSSKPFLDIVYMV